MMNSRASIPKRKRKTRSERVNSLCRLLVANSVGITQKSTILFAPRGFKNTGCSETATCPLTGYYRSLRLSTGTHGPDRVPALALINCRKRFRKGKMLKTPHNKNTRQRNRSVGGGGKQRSPLFICGKQHATIWGYI